MCSRRHFRRTCALAVYIFNIFVYTYTHIFIYIYIYTYIHSPVIQFFVIFCHIFIWSAQSFCLAPKSQSMQRLFCTMQREQPVSMQLMHVACLTNHDFPVCLCATVPFQRHIWFDIWGVAWQLDRETFNHIVKDFKTPFSVVTWKTSFASLSEGSGIQTDWQVRWAAREGGAWLELATIHHYATCNIIQSKGKTERAKKSLAGDCLLLPGWLPKSASVRCFEDPHLSEGLWLLVVMNLSVTVPACLQLDFDSNSSSSSAVAVAAAQ